MSNALILKRTNVPGRQPEAGDLEKNELAYNNYDGRVYIKKIVDGVESLQEVGGVTSVNGYKFDVSLNTDDVPEGENNRYFTESRVKLSLYPGTGVFYDNATGIISIGQPVGTADSVTFDNVSLDGNVLTDLRVDGDTELKQDLHVLGDTTIEGNLTIKGTTTTVESETLVVADNTILLNSNITGTPTENAGVEIERGNNANVLLRWNEDSDYWDFTEDGFNYHRINKLYAGTNISHDQATGVLSVVQGPGSALDADTLDGYHFSDLDSRFVNAAGDTMTGDLTFSEHAGGIKWTRGSDTAALRFYDVTDADPNGRLEFSINGSGNEYYRWVDSTGTELLKLDPADGVNGLTMRGGTVWHAGNDGAGTGMDSDLLDGQQGAYYLDYPNLTNRPVFFYNFASGVASPAPTSFPDLMITGFNAANSTDFPSASMSGVTVKGSTVGAQLAMGWDAEENSPEKIYFRVNDSSSTTGAWGAWQQISIGQPVRTTDSPTFSQITVTNPPTALNQLATLGDLISVPGDLAINTIGSIDIQLTTTNSFAGSVNQSGTPSYISSVGGASVVGNASAIGSNYTVMNAQYSGGGSSYNANITFVIDIANACGLQDNKFVSGTTNINPKWKGNFRINAFSALFKMREVNFWDYVGNNATWEYSINMIPVTTDPDNSSYGKFNVSANVWAARTYHNANIGARWLGTATKYRNLV